MNDTVDSVVPVAQENSLWSPAGADGDVGWTYAVKDIQAVNALVCADGWEAPNLEVTEIIMREADRRHRLTAERKHEAEVERLREELGQLQLALERANSAHWFYYGTDCEGDKCRFDISECISEDFEWDNTPEGDHVLQISGARPVPDMWVALHYFTESEKDEREDDEEYAFTVHETEEAAKSALAAHEATR